MEFIPGQALTDETLVSSTIAEDDYPEWSSSAEYAIGDRVIVTSNHGVFEAVAEMTTAGGTTNKDPVTDGGAATDPPTWWVRIGATNRWRGFDLFVLDRATGTTSIEWVIEPASQINGIALFNLIGVTARVTVEKGAMSYVYEQGLINRDEVTDWWSFFFRPPVQEPIAAFADLPWLGLGTRYTIEVEAAEGEPVGVGQVIFGPRFKIGETRWGPSLGFISASLKTSDEYNLTNVTRRPPRKRRRFPVQVREETPRRIEQLVEDYEATVCAWIGNRDPRLGQIVIGLHADFDFVVELDDYAQYTLEITGII